VLLRLGEAPPDAARLINAAKARRVPLREVAIADPAIAALYERKLVLVRPDGHVAWRGDDAPSTRARSSTACGARRCTTLRAPIWRMLRHGSKSYNEASGFSGGPHERNRETLR
jgi:hypothetical protein